VTGLAEALFALVEDFAGELGELCAQLVTGSLKISETLLMRVLLFAQFGIQAGMGRAQASQLALLRVTFGLQVGDTFKILVTLGPQQLDLTTQRRQLGVLCRSNAVQLGKLAPAAVELSRQTLLGEHCLTEALIEGCLLGATSRQAPLEGQAEPSQGDQAERQANQ